ncbi:class A beta-lactamase-related serine hydrolase [Kribbella turkmenica]|uniref:Class A beta-lactamase-related serine hydrolase n=1 Tax=Kribbella turkmenica TaxID=2530375 RepID=A0A4V2YEN7_9ACTN|nr:serine hydrolase domain-containing protein [Kribbella turkmenica]TDD19816.1 class A beta-lactamase-related serine hydrolase [Kribbella turkmenica]
MKRVLRIVVAGAALGAVIAAPAVAGPGPFGLQTQLDRVVAASAVGGLAEVRDGHRVWRGTSGTAEWGTTRAVPVNGRFRAGSITKTFVATVVLQLVGAGELRLDDPVEKWLPGVVPNGQNITVRHLLNHTSGLADYQKTLPMPPSPEFFANRWRTWTAAEQIRRAVAEPPVHRTPGEIFDYSNTNYILLGEIIEEITGESYADEVERRVIRPLHLAGTEMPGTSPRIRGPHPRGYIPADESGDNLIDFTEMNPSVFGAGGELITTTADLNRFLTALLTGRLLRPHLLAEMKKPGVPGGRYGLGLTWRDTPCGLRAYGNDGDALTYHSWSFSTPDARHQVSVALTPDFDGDTDDYIGRFLDEALCS